MISMLSNPIYKFKILKLKLFPSLDRRNASYLVVAKVADSNVIIIYPNKFEYIKTYHRLSHEACRHKVVRLSLAF